MEVRNGRTNRQASNRPAVWLAAATAGALTSCLSPQHAFMAETVGRGWNAGDPVVVEYENGDTSTLRTLDVILRYSSDFEGSALALAVTTVTPDGYRWRDTVVVRIPGDRPNLGLYHDTREPYRTHVQLGRPGKYLFSVEPLSREGGVNGIAAAGIEIYP